MPITRVLRHAECSLSLPLLARGPYAVKPVRLGASPDKLLQGDRHKDTSKQKYAIENARIVGRSKNVPKQAAWQNSTAGRRTLRANKAARQ